MASSDSLKISSSAVRTIGQNVISKANQISSELETLYSQASTLASNWRDSSGQRLVSQLNEKKANLNAFASSLSQLGQDLVSAADQYDANKAKIDAMIG